MSAFRSLTAVLNPAPLRTMLFQGREHLVVPVIALVEGLVHAGNADKPELVRAQELAVAVAGWNGRPVVLGHPEDDTGPTSAGSPTNLEQLAFGHVFNAHMVGDKLAMEAWLDPAKATLVGADAVDAIARIKRGEVVDVSVGVFVVPETVAVTGAKPGQAGLTEWTRIVPDHLALLPKGVPGACSLEMGCGAPRAARAHQITAWRAAVAAVPELRAAAAEPHPFAYCRDTVIPAIEKHGGHIDDPDAFCGWWKSQNARAASGASGKRGSMLDQLKSLLNLQWLSKTAADAGDGDLEIRDALSRALRADVPGFLGVEMVFPDEGTVVYACAPGDEVTLYKRSFTTDDSGTYVLGDDAQVVKPTTSYEPVEARDATAPPVADAPPAVVPPAADAPPAHTCTCGGSVPAADRHAAAPAPSTERNAMKERTKKLIKKSDGKLTEADAEWLDALPEKALKFMTLSAGIPEEGADDPPAAPPVAAPVVPVVAPVVADPPAPVRAAAAAEPPAPVVPPAPLTSEEWMAAAPPEIRGLVDRAKADEAGRKLTLLSALKGKTTGAYTEAELQAMPVDQLARIAKLAIKEQPRTAIDFSGAIVTPAPDPTVIPPAPDLHARVRAAAVAKGVKGVVQPPTVQ